jgi:acyl-CoA hydrolase
MQTYTMVRPEHLNHHGHLFGGQLLLWVDEYAWMAAARENPGCKLVTRAMDRIEFQRPAPVGSILRFDIEEKSRGRTSLNYSVDVYCDAPGETGEYRIFTTTVTFVSVDARGEKAEICPPRGNSGDA